MPRRVIGAALITAAVLAVSAVRPHAQANARVYHATVSVADTRGNAVRDLAADDFVVSVGDVVRPATRVDLDTRPLSVVVIIDGVESTEVLQARAALAAVLRQFRRGGADVRIGLILGDEGASVPVLRDAQDAVTEQDRRVSRFFQAPQTAPPADTLAAAAAALRKEEGRRRAVVLMSVNRRGAAAQYLGDLVTDLRRAEVVLAAVETGRGQDQSLWLIQNAVGGVYERVSDVAALAMVGSRLAGGLMSAYQVAFSAAETTNQPLRITVKGRRGLIVIVPSWATMAGAVMLGW